MKQLFIKGALNFFRSFKPSRMDSTPTEVVFEFGPYLRAYKNGRVERFFGTDKVPSINSDHGVSSKNVLIDQKTGLSAPLNQAKSFLS